MNTQDVIAVIRSALEYGKQKGDLVSASDLGGLLDNIEKEVSTKEGQGRAAQPLESALAEYKAKNDANLAEYRVRADSELEQFRSVIQSGQAALKSAILINGGAAVALLAFLGRIWQKPQSTADVSGLTMSLLEFIFGVLAVAVASGTTYICQYSYGRNWIKTGHTINIVSILLVVISYILFGLGSYSAYQAFVTHLQPK